MHVHGHERFDLNDDKLLGTIWEHTKEKKIKKEVRGVLNLEPCFAQKAKVLHLFI